jgi:hypothetical protein
LLVFPSGYVIVPFVSGLGTDEVVPCSPHTHSTFDESTTFQLTDWLDHVPKEVLAKNFQTDLSAFEYIPGAELYIFPSRTYIYTFSTLYPSHRTFLTAEIPAEPPAEGATDVSDPQGQVPDAFSFSASTMPATNLTGGSVKIVDSSTFTVSTEIAMAEVTVNPGAIRELHVSAAFHDQTLFSELTTLSVAPDSG